MNKEVRVYSGESEKVLLRNDKELFASEPAAAAAKHPPLRYEYTLNNEGYLGTFTITFEQTKLSFKSNVNKQGAATYIEIPKPNLNLFEKAYNLNTETYCIVFELKNATELRFEKLKDDFVYIRILGEKE
jgi:hypothetical protein